MVLQEWRCSSIKILEDYLSFIWTLHLVAKHAGMRCSVSSIELYDLKFFCEIIYAHA